MTCARRRILIGALREVGSNGTGARAGSEGAGRMSVLALHVDMSAISPDGSRPFSESRVLTPNRSLLRARNKVIRSYGVVLPFSPVATKNQPPITPTNSRGCSEFTAKHPINSNIFSGFDSVAVVCPQQSTRVCSVSRQRRSSRSGCKLMRNVSVPQLCRAAAPSKDSMIVPIGRGKLRWSNELMEYRRETTPILPLTASDEDLLRCGRLESGDFNDLAFVYAVWPRAQSWRSWFAASTPKGLPMPRPLCDRDPFRHGGDLHGADHVDDELVGGPGADSTEAQDAL